MQWILNELSLQNQFDTTDDLCSYFRSLLNARQQSPALQKGLLCSRQTGEQSAINDLKFREVVQRHQDRNFRALVLNWIAKAGPFWEDIRDGESQDLCLYESTEVTENGLGEAARQALFGHEVKIYSLSERNNKFSHTPLIIQRITNDSEVEIAVPNLWQIQDLIDSARLSTPPPETWPQAIENFKQQYDRLIFSEEINDQLKPHPFSSLVVKRFGELLSVLQAYMNSRTVSGTHTEATNEILSNHFSGAKAWFTDESDSNRHNFKNELTFSDPIEASQTLFCPFHGKVKTPQFRIHFSWPVEAAEQYIKIVYMGPKITKR